MTEFVTPIGRIVGGHPMVHNEVKDNRGKPKLNSSGETYTAAFVALAIPKNGEADFKQTEWGRQMLAVAQSAWPGGQSQRPDFAWKVVDGDSQVPDKKNIKPCDREGYRGHWVIKASTNFQIKCYHVGKYDPAQQIQEPKEIQPGDYGRLLIQVKGNDSTDSPGIYVNPSLFELTRKGEYIELSTGTSAEEAFGGGSPSPAPAANTAPAPAPAAAPPPVQPAHDILEPKLHVYQGQKYTKQQLLDAGWNEQQIATLESV